MGEYSSNALLSDTDAAVPAESDASRPITRRSFRQRKRCRTDDGETDPAASENVNLEDPLPHSNADDLEAESEDSDADDELCSLGDRDLYDSDDEEEDFPPVPDADDIETAPNTEMLNQFRKHCMANEQQLDLTEEETCSIKLMDVLR